MIKFLRKESPKEKIHREMREFVKKARRQREEDAKSVAQNDEIAHFSIVEVMALKKRSAFARSFYGLILSFVILQIYIAQYSAAVGFVVLLIIALLANQLVLWYRIRKGYYGNSEYEIKEILRFIRDHSDKSDFNNGDGLKKVFTQSEAMEREISNTADSVPT